MEEVVFQFKKILGAGLMPLNLALLLLAFGSLRLMGGAGQDGKIRGRGMVFLGFLVLLLASLPKVSNPVAGSLEGRYPAINNPERFANAAPGERPRWVVVLGGMYTESSALPVSARLGGSNLKRVVEGIRLARALPQTSLVFTGQGDPSAGNAEVEAIASLARDMGVARSRIVLDGASRDSKDHVANLRATLGNERFLLVSSAIHLPRAMALFEAAGMRPIAAPTAHSVLVTSGRENWLPSLSSLQRSSAAAHEYLGMAWAKLRGQVLSGGDASRTDDARPVEEGAPKTPRSGPKRTKRPAYAPEHGPPPDVQWKGEPLEGSPDDGRLKGWAKPR